MIYRNRRKVVDHWGHQGTAFSWLHPFLLSFRCSQADLLLCYDRSARPKAYKRKVCAPSAASHGLERI